MFLYVNAEHFSQSFGILNNRESGELPVGN